MAGNTSQRQKISLDPAKRQKTAVTKEKGSDKSEKTVTEKKETGSSNKVAETANKPTSSKSVESTDSSSKVQVYDINTDSCWWYNYDTLFPLCLHVNFSLVGMYRKLVVALLPETCLPLLPGNKSTLFALQKFATLKGKYCTRICQFSTFRS